MGWLRRRAQLPLRADLADSQPSVLPSNGPWPSLFVWPWTALLGRLATRPHLTRRVRCMKLDDHRQAKQSP